MHALIRKCNGRHGAYEKRDADTGSFLRFWFEPKACQNRVCFAYSGIQLEQATMETRWLRWWMVYGFCWDSVVLWTLEHLRAWVVPAAENYSNELKRKSASRLGDGLRFSLHILTCHHANCSYSSTSAPALSSHYRRYLEVLACSTEIQHQHQLPQLESQGVGRLNWGTSSP